MRNIRFLIALGLTLGVAGSVHATCTSGGDPCNAPRNPVVGTVSATQIPLTLQNAATPNVTNSIYFFQATTLGSAQNAGTPDRNTVIVLTADFTNPAQPTDVIGQTIRPLLASTSYNLFGKTCPPGSALPTAAGCSAWVSAGSRTTGNLTNAGFSNIVSADTAPRQFTARTNTSVVNQTDVVAWLAHNLNSTEVGNCSFTSSIQPFPQTGTTSLSIDQNACSTLVPNRPYTLVEHLVYDPTQNAPNFTSGVFYTRAADPVADNVTNITHCSAILHYHNAVANPANPNDTTYSVNVGGPVSSGSATQTNVIGGTGIFSDADSVTFTNLQAGTAYNANVTALNRGGGTWRNSNADGFSQFTTIAWGGTFTINSVTTNSANAVVASVDTTGITTWEIRNGATVLASGNASDINGTHPVSGLTPNTVYNLKIFINEATCGSSFNFPAFTTTPVAPASATFANVLPTSLQITWTDPSANPNGSTFEIQLCTDNGFSVGCQTNTVNKPGTSTTFTVAPSTTYFGRVRTRNVSRPTWPDSAYTNTIPASVTTPPNQSSISVSPNPGNAVTGTPLNFTATVFDQSGNAIPGQTVTWSYSGGNAQLSTTLGTNTNLTATASGNFNLTASLAGYPNTVVPVTVSNSGPVVQTPTVSFNADNKTANLSCLASDPGYPESQLVYTWSVQSPSGVTVDFSANGTNAAKNAVATLHNAGTFVFRCTARDPANFSNFALSAAANRTQVLSAITVSPNNVTINLSNIQNFTANWRDQFGNIMPTGSVTWSATGGSVTGAGAFQASGLGFNIRVTATNGAISGVATVNVVNYDVSAAKAYPVPFKSTQSSAITFTGLGSDAHIRIYSTSGRLVFSTHVTSGGDFPWAVINSAGEKVASGVYLYVIESPTTTKHGKLIIIQ